MKTWQEAWDWAAAECDAWNRRDLDAIMAHYADDVALSSPVVVARMGRADGWLHGKAEVRKYFEIGLRAPGLHFELIDVLFGVNVLCMIFRRETGVTVSDTFELDDQNRVTRLLACSGRRP
ncbi:MAG TPA: nuclear transport factor 2 family protein [Xanthobacteraceae bacterium]|nr:nuclear transport factor 2 family protein [Xanthobacteraceae bacterium]